MAATEPIVKPNPGLEIPPFFNKGLHKLWPDWAEGFGSRLDKKEIEDGCTCPQHTSQNMSSAKQKQYFCAHISPLYLKRFIL
jgi:hypothetical protein